MKKTLTILLCGVLTLTLTACGDKSTSVVKAPTASSSANETPYKAPSASKGGTTIIEDRTDSDTASKPSGTTDTTGTTSNAADDYEVEEDLGGVNILRYRGEGGKVSIPSVIGGEKVIQIGEHAFRGSAVTNVTIPATVREIETHAFTGCDSLEFLTIAEGVEVIDGYAFSECPKLSLVSLPDSIKEINSGAFRNCPNLMLTYKGQTYTAANVEDLYFIF